MEKSIIQIKLKESFEILGKKGQYGETDYTANEVRMLLTNIKSLINLYPTDSNIKEVAIIKINDCIRIASNYYELNKGYDNKNRTNPNIPFYKYVNPAYDALELFLYRIM